MRTCAVDPSLCSPSPSRSTIRLIFLRLGFAPIAERDGELLFDCDVEDGGEIVVLESTAVKEGESIPLTATAGGETAIDSGRDDDICRGGGT